MSTHSAVLNRVFGYNTYLLFIEKFAQLPQPLVPISLLKNRGYNAAVCSALVGNMVYFSMR